MRLCRLYVNVIHIVGHVIGNMVLLVVDHRRLNAIVLHTTVLRFSHHGEVGHTDLLVGNVHHFVGIDLLVLVAVGNGNVEDHVIIDIDQSHMLVVNLHVSDVHRLSIFRLHLVNTQEAHFRLCLTAVSMVYGMVEV